MQERLDGIWEGVVVRDPNAVRPEVEVERYISPPEWAETMVTCLHSEGFGGASVGEGGGVDSGELPRDQGAAYTIAEYVCNARFPTDPKFLAPLNDEQLEAVYLHFTTSVPECFAQYGITPGEAPSLVRFKETWDTDQFWSPFSEEVTPALYANRKNMIEITDACPDRPEGFYG